MLEIDNTILKEINNELLSGTKVIMDLYGLGDSDLEKSLEWLYKDDVFVLLANDYFKWLNTGRKPRARKVPIEPLIKWMKKKNIQPRGNQTYNSLAFAIQNGIYKNGIKARKFVDPIVEFSLDAISEFIVVNFSVSIAEDISKELEKLELKVKI